MISIVERLATGRILPVVVLEDARDAGPLGAALSAGGLDCLEITLRTDAAIESIRRLADEGRTLVGAGTVLTRMDVDRAAQAGARFVVSPGLSRVVVRHCQEIGLPVFPGVATATEVMAALDLGLSTLKFFPAAHAGGPAAIRALAAPFGSVRFIPTGGVSADNLAEYLREPAVLAVGGSWMLAPDLLRARAWELVTERSREAVDAARV
jgi:2-dehydro-3-deoxyphosphogluconate aldolase/(4S)-4-hydroxy-2-oxoglutarate aldolase